MHPFHPRRLPDPRDPRPRTGIRALVLVSLAATACGLTLLFLGMRALMAAGGMCAVGATPYAIERPCPQGLVPFVLGLYGGGACFGLYLYCVSRHELPSLVPVAWSALFLTLGWNFLEFGAGWAPGSDGLVWGWLVCAIVFAVMGGYPLPASLADVRRRFAAPPPAPPSNRRRVTPHW